MADANEWEYLPFHEEVDEDPFECFYGYDVYSLPSSCTSSTASVHSLSSSKYMLIDRDNRVNDSNSNHILGREEEEQKATAEKEGYDVVDAASLNDSLVVTQDDSDESEILEKALWWKTVFENRRMARLAQGVSSAANCSSTTECRDQNE